MDSINVHPDDLLSRRIEAMEGEMKEAKKEIENANAKITELEVQNKGLHNQVSLRGLDAYNVALDHVVLEKSENDKDDSAPSSKQAGEVLFPPVSVLQGMIENFEKKFESTDEVTSKLENEIKELRRRLDEAENQLGIESTTSLVPWKNLRRRSNEQGAAESANAGSTNNNERMSDSFKLSTDVYSIIACWNWNSQPFLISLFVVFALQMGLLILLLMDQTEIGTQNPLNIPANVELTVRIAQFLALFVAVFSHGDLRTGIEGMLDGLPTGFRGNQRFLLMNSFQWNCACFLRFVQGFLGLFASFLLLIQAETVFDLLLNFMGIEFISNLDDLAFYLGTFGYLGLKVQECTKNIKKVEFHQEGKSNPNRSCFKKYAHVYAVLAVLVAMLSAIAVFAAFQDDGTFSIKEVHVEFGDDTLPYLGLFNGCYKANDDNFKMIGRLQSMGGRLEYEQVGRKESSGKFGFCKDVEDNFGQTIGDAWIFFDDTQKEDPCSNYIVRSGTTRTFDLIEASNSQWYTKDNLLLEYLQISEVFDGSSKCGELDAVRASCEQLELDGVIAGFEGTTSRFFEKIGLDSRGEEDEIDGFIDIDIQHPLYIGNRTKDDFREVVFFTGRRWVFVDTSKVGAFNKSLSSLKHYFLSDEASGQGILLISEIIESAIDKGTPLGGLQWYSPRYETNSTYPNFPAADLTRPDAVGFRCALCNSDSNPCLYEGICDDNTGECDCMHDTSGPLCRDVPVGDGVCQPYFNTEQYDYDLGDCCWGTCKGSLCGINGIQAPYDLALKDGFSFIDEGLSFIGYEHCKDPDLAHFTVVMEYDYTFSDETCELTVKCEDMLHTQISPLRRKAFVEEFDSYSQKISVPYGTKCEISCNVIDEMLSKFFEYDDAVQDHLNDPAKLTVLYDKGTETVPVVTEYYQPPLKLVVPESKCLVKRLSNYPISLFNPSSVQSKAIQWLSSDGISDRKCLEEDDQFLLERYVLTLLDSDLYSNSSDTSRLSSLHHCDSWNDETLRIILCNENKNIIWLKVDQGGEKVPFPTALSFLSNLELLTIGSSVFGPMPSELGELRNLKSLTIGYNDDLHGLLPSELGNLQKLTHLDLSHNSFEGQIPTDLAKLQNLTYLDLRDNTLDGSIVSELGSLQKLTFLDLSYNALEGSITSELGNLQSLTWLGLGRNLLGGSIASETGKLHNLTYLSLSPLGLEGSIPSELGSLQELTFLTLAWNNLEGTIPTELGRLQNLGSLTLAYNNLEGHIPTELGNLQNLNTLFLGSNNLEGLIPTELNKLPLVTCFLASNEEEDNESNNLAGTPPEACQKGLETWTFAPTGTPTISSAPTVSTPPSISLAPTSLPSDAPSTVDCYDYENWRAGFFNSYRCSWLETHDYPGCPLYGNYLKDEYFGIAASEACCYCNGGIKSSSPAITSSAPSLAPTTSAEATLICHDYENWMDTWGDSCDWYVENEIIGCPTYGSWNSVEGISASEACCHCDGGIMGTASPTTSSAPSAEPSKSAAPTSTCFDEENWLDAFGDSCDWYEEHDEKGCPNFGNKYPNEDGIDATEACCYCRCFDYEGWLDWTFFDCTWYEENEDPGCPSWGQTPGLGSSVAEGVFHTRASEACCHCGGGEVP